jgi:hypothetical protein
MIVNSGLTWVYGHFSLDTWVPHPDTPGVLT